MNISKSIRKVVITGGPGGGKTTALDLFRRELEDDVAVVPESATMLFSSGVERSHNKKCLEATQETIFCLQKNLENLISLQHPNKLLICDRGTMDGLAYWPGAENEFFSIIDSEFDIEMSQYDAVIFFETGACSGSDIKSNNPYRHEDSEQAVLLDKKLQDIWSRHPNYHFVPSSQSFVKKIMLGIETIKKVIRQ